MMIKAVIFDCFGVLTTDGWLAFRSQYLMSNTDAYVKATLLNRMVDTGQISYDEYASSLSELSGVDKSEVLRLMDSHISNEKLFEYIKKSIKIQYKIGLLSNAAGNFLDELFDTWQIELFDAMTFSYELGVIKPHILMYETIADKLGVAPSECLFIDDREGFCQGARDAGMQAIHFQNTEQAIEDIDKIISENA